MQRILVTGATGLIGRHLCKDLLIKEHAVWGIGRSYESLKNLRDIIWIPCNLSEPIDANSFPENLDVIIHLAQSQRFREFPEGAKDVFKVNTQSTLELLDFAQKTGIKQFIYASTGGIYGFGEKPFKENDVFNPFEPLNMYLTSKYASELIIGNYSGFFSNVIMRLFFVYGPGQREDMLIPRLIANVKNGKPITLDGENGILINPIYVGDVVETIERIMEQEITITLNVGGHEVLSMRQIGDIIGNVVGVKPVFECNQDIKPKHLIGDITKMSSMLGTPKTSFMDGIKKVVNVKR